MRLFTIICLLFFFFSASAIAQSTYSVKGVIADSVEHVKLNNTSVAVLQAKDSILVKYTRAAEDGSFSVAGLPKGKFILLVSYPDYADYVEPFSIDSANQVHNFGHINMALKARLLKEVIVKGTAAQMKIKGDTTEFNARAFVTQPNAKVEDLLKQLPGITVDKDGKITAQGETVNKVLVDGEEFFGDDPTLVTKNIRADMVDKVQLYDKKSDQAAFTGIDDGKKEKTINIKLREDKKNGMFGKAEAGDSPQGIYQGQLLFNAFKAKQKFSVYGTIGNNGKIGLGWQDNQKYGGGDGFQTDDSGNGFFFISGGNDDLDSFNGQYNGQGIPLARSGGVHYDSKWKDDKQSINLNYKIGTLNVDETSSNITQNNLKDSIINSNTDQTSHNYMFRHKLDIVYQVKLDTSSNLKITVGGTSKHSTTAEYRTGSDTTTIADTRYLTNANTRDLTNTVDQKLFNASAFYTHKFHKTGRTFSLNVSESYSQSMANGYLKSEIDFYNKQGVIDSTQRIDELKTNNLQSQTLATNATYTEPFSKALSLLLNYGVNINNSTADRQTFNQSAPGVYTSPDSALSSNYRLNQLSNQVGAVLNYKKNKIMFNFGAKVSDVSFRETDQFTGNRLDRNFIDWFPQARFQYRFSQQKSFSINYNGNTVQPTLDQIQPLRVNNDPLNIVLGNPNLTPSFTNNVFMFYNSYKVISDQYLFIGGNYSFTSNPIISHVSYGSGGISTSQYFNLPGKETSNFSLWSNIGRKIQKLGINIGFNLNANGNVYYNYVNDALNMTKSYTFNPGINFGKYQEKKIEFNLSGGPTYTISQSSLQPNVNNNGWGARSDLNFTLYLPWKFQIGSNSEYQYTAKTQSFPTDFSKVLVNAFLIKSFLKQDNLKLELWANDLLNQNVGFQRTANANLITQNSYTTLKRYFMFTVTYDFSKMAGGAAKK